MRTKFVLFLLCLGIVTSSAVAGAADGGSLPIDTPKPIPHFVKINGQTYLDFQDGRVAGFFQMIGPVRKVTAELRQTENTCDYTLPLTECTLETDAAVRQINLKWVQHPDNAKVGQVVSMHYASNPPSKVTVNTFSGFWFNSIQDGIYKEKFQADRFSCKNFDWLTNARIENGFTKIDSWVSEEMSRTVETQTDENQTVTGVFDVSLKKINPQTYEFASVGSSYAPGNSPPYFPAQVTALSFRDNHQNICQVSFESDISSARKVLSDPSIFVMDPATELPLTNGILLRQTGISFQISGLLLPGSTLVVE